MVLCICDGRKWDGLPLPSRFIGKCNPSRHEACYILEIRPPIGSGTRQVPIRSTLIASSGIFVHLSSPPLGRLARSCASCASRVTETVSHHRATRKKRLDNLKELEFAVRFSSFRGKPSVYLVRRDTGVWDAGEFMCFLTVQSGAQAVIKRNAQLLIIFGFRLYFSPDRCVGVRL